MQAKPTTSRAYYAEHNRYGVGTTTERVLGRGRDPIITSAGQLYRFATRAERDAWVAADVWDGRRHRRALTAEQARKTHATGSLATGYWIDDEGRSSAERWAGRR